jgi:thiol:disulfide interchange protein
MDRPPVFADQSFTAALEATRSSTRLLIVDAAAEWCGPCKHMDRTTWRDLEVVCRGSTQTLPCSR